MESAPRNDRRSPGRSIARITEASSQASRAVGKHGAILVVRMCDDVQNAGVCLQFLQAKVTANGAAIQLKKAGIHSFTMFERASEIGGGYSLSRG